ncbi:MAG: hypothetical protein L0154_15125 [Chloroflexi bacterium]|nr:hypothetical protein [Chloroflexota bacterium]
MDLTAFETQLIDVTAIWALTSPIYGVHGTFDLIPRIILEPSATEWGTVRRDVQLGMTVGEALRNLRDRVPSPGMQLLLEMYESQGEYPDLKALDEALQILWERYDPDTKPENSSVKNLMTLAHQLRNQDIYAHEEAIRQFVGMQDRAIPYLVDPNSLAEDRLPATINLLKVIGTEAVIKNLTRFTRFKWIKPGHGVMLKLALGEYSMGYKPNTDNDSPCQVCRRLSADTLGAYCWFCNAFACEEHVVRTDRNHHATFCSQQHLAEANKYLGYWI